MFHKRSDFHSIHISFHCDGHSLATTRPSWGRINKPIRRTWGIKTTIMGRIKTIRRTLWGYKSHPQARQTDFGGLGGINHSEAHHRAIQSLVGDMGEFGLWWFGGI